MKESHKILCRDIHDNVHLVDYILFAKKQMSVAQKKYIFDEKITLGKHKQYVSDHAGRYRRLLSYDYRTATYPATTRV
jgi:hypothetical protein